MFVINSYLHSQVSHYKTTLRRKHTVVCMFVLPERIQKAIGLNTSFARTHSREALQSKIKILFRIFENTDRDVSSNLFCIFQCMYCVRSFALKSTMIAHERTHTGVKKYACDSCDKTFACHSSLTAHTRQVSTFFIWSLYDILIHHFAYVSILPFLA